MNRGFTLIEMIVYIALFTILLTSGFTAAFQIIKSGDNLDSKLRTEEEGNFILHKIAWSLSSLDPVTSPVISGTACNQNLTTYRTDLPNPVSVRLHQVSGINYIEIEDDGVSYYPISTANVTVSCLNFISSASPAGITANVTVNGNVITVTRYMRN